MAENIRLGFCDACPRDRQMLAEIRLRSGRVISLCKACLANAQERIVKTEKLYQQPKKK